ncbi:MAG TPA: PAS domain S-box protein [Thermosynechococcaceae cyanobacterium]
MSLDQAKSNSDRLQPLTPLAQLSFQSQTAEEQLATVVENMVEAFFALDLTGRCTYFNQKAEELLGGDRTTLIGKTVWDLFCIDAASQLYQQCHRAAIEQLSIEFEEFYPWLERWFIVRLLPSPSGLSAYFQDITKRKETEARLRKEQEFLNVLLDNVQAGIVACDQDGRLILFNKAARSFHGMSEQPLPPEQWADQYDLYLPDGKTLMNTEDIPLYQALRGQQVRDVEMVIAPKQGETRLLSANGQATHNLDGEKQGAVVVMHDITARKQAEAELLISDTALQQMPDAILLTDLEGNIQRWLGNAEKIFGYTAAEAIGQPINFLHHPDLRAEMTAQIIQFIRETGEFCGEIPCVRKDGSLVLIETTSKTVYDKAGNPIFFIGINKDITERKQAEAERAQLIRQQIKEQIARSAIEADLQRSSFLVEVSAALASSLDYEQTLQSVARLAVPYFADWCCVDLLNDDHTISRVAVAHSNPEKVQLGWDLAQRFPRKLDDGYGISEVMKTGRSEIAIDITDEQLASTVSNPDYLKILQGVGLKSCVIAPLQARERILGSISFVFTESNRRYCMDDLRLAEDLARRAAIAIDNARLYHTAQQAKQAAEIAADRTARLQMVTAALSESLTPVQVADVIVEQSTAALEADAALMVLLSKDGTTLEIVRTVGYGVYQEETYRQFSIDSSFPLADAVRTGQPVWAEPLAERLARYPHLADIYKQLPFQSWISLPLIVEGKAVGGLSLSFKQFRLLNQDDREFILALTRQCAQAISRSQLYEAERTARAEAEQANRVKDEFLAVLSHELRTPLNPILGWAKILQTGKLQPDKANQALATIERNAKLQAQLVEDLLDISRMLQGKLSLNIAPVNLTTVIQSAIETVQLAAAAKSTQIQMILQPIEKIVLGDTNRLQQVIWNLLSNAIKFTPNNGQVTVHLKELDHQIQIQIIDNGKGINPDFLPHVFEYFRQADSSITRNFGGLGLGLAIARQIVELHGGRIWAESPGEGLGATFTVCLPIAAATSESATALESSPQTADLTGLQILVVDDEADMRDLAEFILVQHGAQVRVATSAAEAVTALSQFVPDVLLCDIGMPEVDGYGLIRQIREWLPEKGGMIPAIALTAYAGEYNQQQALKAGFQRHVAKPVEPEILIRAIVTLVREKG